MTFLYKANPVRGALWAQLFAQKAPQQTFRIWPDMGDPAQVHFQLAKLLHARGGSETEARRHVLKSLEEAPRFRDAQRLLLEITGETSQPSPGKTASGK